MKTGFWVLSLCGLVFLTGCLRMDSAQSKEKRWKAERVAVIEQGLATPECVVSLKDSDLMFISNIHTDNEGYWENDSNGYITLANKQGQIIKQAWLGSTASHPIHAPKGMCILGGWLYFNDNTQLKRCNAATGQNLEVIAGLEGNQFNDLATDGKEVWVSDKGAGQIVRVKPDGTFCKIKAPEYVNGVTCRDGRVFAVSANLHEVYQIDTEGIENPAPFGLADHFTYLDGIEILDDGTFIISDLRGGKICTIQPDRRTVHTLIEIESPADIGLDREKGLLLIPQFKTDKVFIYRLSAL